MNPFQAKTALITGITGQDGAYLTDSTNLIRIIQETHRSPYAAARLDWGFAGDYVEAAFAEVGV